MRKANWLVGVLECVLVAAGGILSLAGAQAAVVLDYDLSTVPNTAVTSVAATTVGPGLSATELTRGSGLVATNLTRGFSANDWATTTASRANALETNQFFQFGFTVQPGGSVSLSQLEVALRRSATAAPMNYEWQYSLDGFTSAGNSISVAGSPYYSTGNFTYFGRSSGGAGAVADNFNYMEVAVPLQDAGNVMPPLDLSGITALQNITSGSSVSFRLYGWGDGGGASSNTVALGRNLGPRLSGVAVPEPAGLLVASGWVLAAAVLRRRGSR
jgi:hypothetical protein